MLKQQHLWSILCTDSSTYFTEFLQKGRSCFEAPRHHVFTPQDTILARTWWCHSYALHINSRRYDALCPGTPLHWTHPCRTVQLSETGQKDLCWVCFFFATIRWKFYRKTVPSRPPNLLRSKRNSEHQIHTPSPLFCKFGKGDEQMKGVPPPRPNKKNHCLLFIKRRQDAEPATAHIK